ncbi:hypothetical protein ACFL0Q_08470 [Thermodesulfobacteriota bacterium]
MVYERFHAALVHLVSRGGHGAQASLARRAGISKSHVTLLLKRKRGASKQTQENIARAFGYTHEHFLTLGRRLLIESPLEEQMALQLPEGTADEEMSAFYMRVSDGMPLRWHLSAKYKPILPEDQFGRMRSADCIEDHEKWLAVMRQVALGGISDEMDVVIYWRDKEVRRRLRAISIGDPDVVLVCNLPIPGERIRPRKK